MAKANKFKKIAWIGGGIFAAAGIVTAAILFANTKSADDQGKYGPFDDSSDGDYLTAGLVGAGGVVAGVIWTSSFLISSNHYRKKAINEGYTISLIENDLMDINDSRLAATLNVMDLGKTHDKGLGLGLKLYF